MMRVAVAVFMICAVGVVGCSTTSHGPAVGKAIGGAAGAIVGHQYGESGIGKSLGSQLGGVAGQLAQAARKRSGSQHIAAAGQVKAGEWFCPVAGEQYDQGFKYCPFHGVELRSRGN